MQLIDESGDSPKLNLFTLGDFEYIQGKIRDRISTLTEQRTKVQGLEDDTAEQLKTLLDRWMSQMFSILTPNILINGLPYSTAFSLNEAYEPRSLELVDTLEELSKKRTELLMKVLKLRDQVPEAVYENLLRLNRESSSEYISKNTLLPKEENEEDDEIDTCLLYTEDNERYERFSDHYQRVSCRTKELCGALETLNEMLINAVELIGDPNDS